MNIMAIEDGLFPLAYVTHTIKYLQQCKFFLFNQNTRKQLAKLHQLIFEVKWRGTEMAKYNCLSR